MTKTAEQSEVIVMASLLRCYTKCRKILCEVAKRGDKITFGQLATELGLKNANLNEWHTVLDSISTEQVRRTGRDLTLVVVHASTGISPYFSDIRAGQAPRTKSNCSPPLFAFTV